MTKPPMIPPPAHRGPPGIDKGRMDTLKRLAVPLSEHTAVVTDFDHGQILICARRQLDIQETVIAFPLSLLLQVAAQITQQIAVPMLAKIEHAPKMPSADKAE